MEFDSNVIGTALSIVVIIGGVLKISGEIKALSARVDGVEKQLSARLDEMGRHFDSRLSNVEREVHAINEHFRARS